MEFLKIVPTQTRCKYVSSHQSQSLIDVVPSPKRNLNPSVNVTPKANANEVSILHLNIRSIRNKLQDLEALVYGLDSLPAIICLTETHLENDDESHTFAVPGHNEVEANHRNRYGGGVTIQVHSRATSIKTFETPFEEAICAQIKFSYLSFKVLVIYNRPRTNEVDFIDTLDQYLQDNTSATVPFVICGDFNIDTKVQNQITRKYSDVIVSNGFALFNEFDQATRVTDHSATYFDHFIYQNIPVFSSVVLSHQNIADHYPIMCVWSIDTDDDKLISQQYRDMKFIHDPIKVQAFLNSLEAGLGQRESELFLFDDPNEAFSIFNTEYISHVEKFAPLETFRKQTKLKPNWFNNSLKNLRMKRNQAHRKWKHFGNTASWSSFHYHRNKFELAYKKAKKNVFC